MSGFGTKFTETEALLYAAEDSEADSGVYTVDDYLRENFLPGELSKLEDAAEVLASRARLIRQEMRRTSGGPVGVEHGNK